MSNSTSTPSTKTFSAVSVVKSFSGRHIYKRSHAALFGLAEVLKSEEFQHVSIDKQIGYWRAYLDLMEENDSLEPATRSIIGSLSSRKTAQDILSKIQVLQGKCRRESLRRQIELAMEALQARLDVPPPTANFPELHSNDVTISSNPTRPYTPQDGNQQTEQTSDEDLDLLRRYAETEISRLRSIRVRVSENNRDSNTSANVQACHSNTLDPGNSSGSMGRVSAIATRPLPLISEGNGTRSGQDRTHDPAPVYRDFSRETNTEGDIVLTPVDDQRCSLAWNEINALDGDDPNDNTSLHTTSSNYGSIELSQVYTERRINAGLFETEDGIPILHSARPAANQRDMTRSRYRRNGSLPGSITPVPEYTEAESTA